MKHADNHNGLKKYAEMRVKDAEHLAVTNKTLPGLDRGIGIG